MDCLPWLRNKYENINYMIVTQDLVCNSILSLHPAREMSGKFSQNGIIIYMSGQKGKVHLGTNVNSSAH